MDFCKRYNAETADKTGQIIPVEITVYEVSLLLDTSTQPMDAVNQDRTFSFVTKTPPASFLLKQAAGLDALHRFYAFSM